MSARRDGWAGRILASSGELSPLTGEVLAQVPQSSVDDVAAAFDRGRAVQEQWAQVPARERAGRLVGFHDLVMGARTELIEPIVAEDVTEDMACFGRRPSGRWWCCTGRRHRGGHCPGQRRARGSERLGLRP